MANRKLGITVEHGDNLPFRLVDVQTGEQIAFVKDVTLNQTHARRGLCEVSVTLYVEAAHINPPRTPSHSELLT